MITKRSPFSEATFLDEQYQLFILNNHHSTYWNELNDDTDNAESYKWFELRYGECNWWIETKQRTRNKHKKNARKFK